MRSRIWREHFGVAHDELTLTNGTDEAIQLLINTYVDDGDRGPRAAAVVRHVPVLLPTAGARRDEVDYRPGNTRFSAGRTARTHYAGDARGAHQQSEQSDRHRNGRAVIRTDSAQRPTNAAVLIDEAYYEFSGVTMLCRCSTSIRICLSAAHFRKSMAWPPCAADACSRKRQTWRYVRKAQSPYSVNALAAMAARIAVQDQAFVEEYVLEVLAARELLYVGLEHLRIPYIKSQANFVLFQAGDRAIQIRDELRNRGVLVRDRSYELPGCRARHGRHARTGAAISR